MRSKSNAIGLALGSALVAVMAVTASGSGPQPATAAAAGEAKRVLGEAAQQAWSQTGGVAEDVVDDPERVEDAGVLLDHVLEPVVGDGDEGVDLVAQGLARLLGIEAALGALEALFGAGEIFTGGARRFQCGAGVTVRLGQRGFRFQ
jgi:hypothetical protein